MVIVMLYIVKIVIKKLSFNVIRMIICIVFVFKMFKVEND